MEKKIIFLFALITIKIAAFGQNRNEAVTVSGMFQVDSSEFFVLGKLIDKSTKAKYGASTRVYNGYTNAYVYNSKSKKVVSVFPNGTNLIYPFYDNFYNSAYTWGQALRSSLILKNNIVFLVQDTDLNGDGIIDDDDPASVYICQRNGEHLTKISADELNVVSFSVTKTKETLLFVAQKDSNKDKKYFNDDQLLYQVDLNNDISKVKVTQVVF